MWVAVEILGGLKKIEFGGARRPRYFRLLKNLQYKLWSCVTLGQRKVISGQISVHSSGRSGMTATSSVSNNVRETGKQAREARKAASKTATDIQGELQTLREEFRLLAEQVGNIVADKGSAARAHPSVDDVVSEAQEKGREVIDALRDVTDNFVDAIDKSIKNRPYTTLALFAALAFLLGAARRR